MPSLVRNLLVLAVAAWAATLVVWLVGQVVSLASLPVAALVVVLVAVVVHLVVDRVLHLHPGVPVVLAVLAYAASPLVVLWLGLTRPDVVASLVNWTLVALVVAVVAEVVGLLNKSESSPA